MLTAKKTLDAKFWTKINKPVDYCGNPYVAYQVSNLDTSKPYILHSINEDGLATPIVAVQILSEQGGNVSVIKEDWNEKLLGTNNAIQLFETEGTEIKLAITNLVDTYSENFLKVQIFTDETKFTDLDRLNQINCFIPYKTTLIEQDLQNESRSIKVCSVKKKNDELVSLQE